MSFETYETCSKKMLKRYQKDHFFGSEIDRQNDRNFEATFMRRKDHLFHIFFRGVACAKRSSFSYLFL